ncbi:lipase 3-like [Choristoneura fumiferana]|uniref:lipase 3-like n=1 Tax=Choristoneura fumiferana TaxID=7141 RepID=UPI003D15B906
MLPLRIGGLFVLIILVSDSFGSVILPKNPTVKSFDTPRFKALNFTETAIKHGYKTEEHTVATDDGYILTLFRITKGVKCQDEKKRTPVLLMHGLLLNADCWLDAGPEAGLAYLLSDSCIDTWVGSVRGTHYSRNHINLNPDRDKEFWQFSVDEIGLFDIPALIDYVLNKTGVKQLNYIGFSQGAGTYFIMCSERPGYCDKSKVVIALAPATRHFYTKSILFRGVPQLIMHKKELLEALGVWEIFARGLPLYAFLSNACQYVQAFDFCESVLALFDAPHPGSIASKTYPSLFKHILAGTSTQNIARYGQSVMSKKFIKFNFNSSKNRRLYGGSHPPEYNLSAVSVPVVVIYGENDGIVDERDVKWMIGKLPNVEKTIAVNDRLWNHLDMVFSQYTNIMVFSSIIKYLLQYD